MLTDHTIAPLRLTKLLLVENSLHITGAFQSALAFVDALHASYDIEFVLPTQSTLKSVVEERGIICHQLPMVELGRSWSKLLRYVPQLMINTFRLRRLLSARGVDVLLINDYYNLLGVTVRLTGGRGRLMTMVRLLPMNQHRVLNRVWTALAIRFSDSVVAVSRAVCSQLPESEKIEMIYNPSKFEEKYPAGEEDGAEDGTVQCLYIANYIAGKGHEDALEAFSRAHAVNPSLRLRFVGSDMGLEKNRLLKQALQKKVECLGMAEVVSIGGFSDDVDREMRDTKIALNFSESESFSHTCLEACAFGLPVIATRCGGPEEIIDDGVSGILVPVRDVPAMTDALLTLSRNSALRQSMGRAGKRIVRDRFSEQKFIIQFEKLCKV